MHCLLVLTSPLLEMSKSVLLFQATKEPIPSCKGTAYSMHG